MFVNVCGKFYKISKSSFIEWGQGNIWFAENKERKLLIVYIFILCAARKIIYVGKKDWRE